MMDSNAVQSTTTRGTHVCPWWLGWTLLFPARRWFLDPDRIVAPVVQPGFRVLEVGPGNGFVTIPLAKRVGPQGKVFCVDLQPRMLESLEQRVRRFGLAERVTTRVCGPDNLHIEDLQNTVDLALLVYMLHEVPDQARTLAQVVASLRVGGQLVIVEPKGHCPAELYADQLRICRELGMVRAPEQPEYLASLPQGVLLFRQ